MSDNYSTAVFLIDQTVRAIAVTYEELDMKKDLRTQTGYKSDYLAGGSLPAGAQVMKTRDKSIKIGDFVIMPTGTRHQMTVCKVVAVDIPIGPDFTEEVQWVIATIDTGPFEALREWEASVIGKIREARAYEAQRKLKTEMLSGLGDVDIPALAFQPVPAAPHPVPAATGAAARAFDPNPHSDDKIIV